ncbi:hypothetical protein [Variovorax sp. YR216]|uniref:hypothetical protein n=1 Tax=Variovorax sp. YR216 TaxID=1882828 RepID=UPI00089BB9AB|nr:hypothetical protein [Variovorax sp. YR216]SEB25576.1 hypothetical protein SAMN05444680_12618 [Variovorax sp. YR216]
MNTFSWRMAVVMIRLTALALMPFVQNCSAVDGDPQALLLHGPSTFLKAHSNAR